MESRFTWQAVQRHTISIEEQLVDSGIAFRLRHQPDDRNLILLSHVAACEVSSYGRQCKDTSAQPKRSLSTLVSQFVSSIGPMTAIAFYFILTAREDSSLAGSAKAHEHHRREMCTAWNRKFVSNNSFMTTIISFIPSSHLSASNRD